MTTLNTPVQTPQKYIPPVGSADVPKMAKVTATYVSFAAYYAALQDAQSNAALGVPTWEQGQEILNDEEFGIRRTWDATLHHARNATIRPGLTKPLKSDTNRFWFVTGTPGALLGAINDYGIDWTANVLWFKGGTGWGSVGSLYPSATSSSSTTAAGLTDIASVSLPTINAPLATALGTKTTVLQAAAAAPVQSVAGATGNVTAGQIKTALALALADIPGAVNSAGAAAAAPLQSVAGLQGAPNAATVKQALNITASDISGLTAAILAALAGMTDPPIILNATPTARPGDIVSIQGHNFGTSPTVLLDTPAGTTTLTVLLKVGNWVLVQVPSGAAGSLAVRVQNGGAVSTATKLNAARPYHLDALQVVPGGKVRMLGRNLLLPGYTPAVLFDGLAATVDTANSNEHMLVLTAPASLPATSASVITVDNGNGSGPAQLDRTISVVTGATGDAFSLGVGWAACFTAPAAVVIDTTTDSRMSVKVVADGTTDNSAALQRAVQIAQGLSTGAIVKLPAGNVRLASGVELGPKVILQGAGKTQTTISYTSTSFPIFGGGLDVVGLCDLTVQPVGSAPESVYLHDCTRLFLRNVKFAQGAVHPSYLGNNRNLVVTGCDWIQTGVRDDQGPFTLGGSKGFSFTNNTSTVMTGGCAFPMTSDGYVANSHITRDASYAQTPSSVIHMMTLDFAARIAVIGNTFDVTNGPINPQHNDGETILTEGGGAARTENLGTVQSATTNTLLDSTNFINIDPLGTGSIPENYGVAIVGGKGMGQSRRIVSYASGVITVDKPWAVIPDSTSKYATLVWGLEKSLIKGNILTNNPRGILLYQTGIRDVDVVANTLTQNGGIYLRAYQLLSAKQLMPIWNVKIKSNTQSNTNGVFPANVAIVFDCADGKDFGVGVMGIDVQDHDLTGSVPRTQSNLYDFGGTDGFMNRMNVEASTYETPTTPKVLGTIFQRIRANKLDPVFMLGAGSNGTVIAGTTQVTTGTLVQNDRTTVSAEVATDTLIIA